MIESEEKRKRTTESIERWARHTKIKKYLRDYDIPSLVSQIIDEFYHITLCCGHKVKTMDEGVVIAFTDYVVDRSDMEHGGGMGEVSGLYCKECAEKYKRELAAWEVKLEGDFKSGG